MKRKDAAIRCAGRVTSWKRKPFATAKTQGPPLAPCRSLSSTQVGRRSPPSTQAAELPESLPIGVCHGIRQVVPSSVRMPADGPADVLPPSGGGALLQCSVDAGRTRRPGPGV